MIEEGIKLLTKDGKEVRIIYSRTRPDMPRSVAPALQSLWFNLGDKWVRSRSRNAHTLRSAIKNNTLKELKNKENDL